eukprot:SAG22_NODE_41_length_25488_cov_6.133719_8_plen_358_part_00
MDEDMIWLRATMGNFRPDNIATDYHWRYAESVHTEVAYGDSHCALFNNGTGGVCNGHFSDIPVGGDVCGGRAFWGRFACKGFGRPTWGATEHAHAAMSAWTPTGWTVLLGAPWPGCWWGNVGGLQFVLDTQARENRTEYQKILRGGWVALAKDEEPAPYAVGSGARVYGKGGLWSALMVYMQKIVAADSPPMNRELPAPPADNKIAALVKRWPGPPPPPPAITVAADGTITIPATAFSSKNKSAPVSVLKSFESGEQVRGGAGRGSRARALLPILGRSDILTRLHPLPSIQKVSSVCLCLCLLACLLAQRRLSSHTTGHSCSRTAASPRSARPASTRPPRPGSTTTSPPPPPARSTW